MLHHGGALLAAQRAHPQAPLPWLDLSTGINPEPYPLGDVPLAAWTRLPERDEVSALERAAARAYRVADPAHVVAAPGAQSLIQRLPSLCPARRVAVFGPTYAEHEARWRASGAEVSVVADPDMAGSFDTMVVVNPNNPDGRLVPVEALLRLADRARLLVVDESFMDFSPEASVAPHVDGRPIVVLRSFGKAYGFGGLRLGFAIAPPPLAAAIRDAFGPWAVSGPAIAIGARALADSAWLAETRTRLAARAARLDALLSQAGLRILGGTSLFRLASCADARTLHDHLCAHGVLARAFETQPRWIRFGLPGLAGDWDRLAHALSQPLWRARNDGGDHRAAPLTAPSSTPNA